MIFLGQASNYRFGRALRQLFAHGKKRDVQNLKQHLARRYRVELKSGAQYIGGEKLAAEACARVELYQTGRSALTAAIMATVPKGSKVVIPGLTCIAVVRAVKAAGCEPVFCDINPETLQYDWLALDKTLKVCYNGGIVAQNTLGLPLRMSKLEKLAQKYHCEIIEDLAHSAGRYYPDGRECGTVGVATVLSFGKGKAVDTITGGALVLRKQQTANGEQKREVRMPSPPQSAPARAARWRARWYPVLGWLMRAGYHVGLGKVFTGIFLKLHWIQRSADAELNLDQKLMPWQAKLALKQLEKMPRQFELEQQKLQPQNQPLREWYLVEKRAELLAKFKQKGYYLDEIWYDTPVSPARCAKEAQFPAQDCPRTVEVAQKIINLPTWYSEKKLAPVRAMIKQHQKENHG